MRHDMKAAGRTPDRCGVGHDVGATTPPDHRSACPPPQTTRSRHETTTSPRLSPASTLWAQPLWEGIVRSRTGLVALVTVVLGAAAACGPGSTDRSSSPAAPPLDHHVMWL